MGNEKEQIVMVSKKQWQGEYPVFPTSEGKSNYYSDGALTTLFSAHVDVINSERETIWQRYNVMLAANVAVATFLGISSTAAAHPIRMLAGISFGLGLCYVWLCMTREGWESFDNSCKEASKFAWRALGKYGTEEITYIKELNPIAVQWAGFKREDRIKVFAIRTIKAFAFVYLLIGALYFFGWWDIPKSALGL
jgi:hypothetical protein